VTAGGRPQVRPVHTRGDLRRFIGLPFHLYRDDPNWVPPLRVDRQAFFDSRKNPFYRTAEVALFLAWRGDRAVGRIAACVNRDYNEIHGGETGTFGFFESEDDPETAAALYDGAAEWLQSRGQTRILGPLNFSTNHEVGFLADGFDLPPVVMMTYNPPAYLKHAEAWGFRKAKDLRAYRIDHEHPPADRIRRIAARIRSRDKVTIRSIDLRNFDREIERIRLIYNEAWRPNWGFVPLREEEFRHIARDMKLIVRPELALIAEAAGRPVGFCLALPNIFELQIGIRSGRLLPTGLFRLLWGLKVRPRIHSVRIITMGVIGEYQKRGIESVFYVETFDRGLALGYTWGEISWILEDNQMMIKAAEALGSVHYKTYRIYEREL